HGTGDVCAPLAVGENGAVEGAPTCEAVAKPDLKPYAFQRPRRTKKGKDGTAAAKLLDDAKTIVVSFSDGIDETVLATSDAPHALKAVKTLYGSTDGNLYPVENATEAAPRPPTLR